MSPFVSLFLIAVACTAAARAQFYTVPEATLIAYKPRGFHVSIPDEEGVQLFAFHGNVNKPMKNREGGQLSVDITQPENGRWIYEDIRVRLKPGDVVNYWLYVQLDGLGYPKDGLSWTVPELVDRNTGPKPTPQPQPTPQPCRPSVTTVKNETSCQGKLIFEETFDTLERTKWEPIIRFGGDPDYPFVIYTDNRRNSFVKNGHLNIMPNVLEDNQVVSGKIELHGCTGRQGTNECERQATGAFILPPIYSAKLRTKNNFSFRYGKVEMRAKLPLGDWIYPELNLDPRDNEYGQFPQLTSGKITIALSRGNRDLLSNGQQIGANHLESSCEMSYRNVTYRERYSRNNNAVWADTFHVYTVIWTPAEITFTVDGNEIGKVVPPDGGFQSKPQFSHMTNVPWSRGSKIAPFDREFFISIGIAVGGACEFPDSSVTGNNHPKPWRNQEAKDIAKFWTDRNNWSPTWSDNLSVLQVDYVRVWAI